MKTSLDLPDNLYRQLKAKSALAGKSVREVATSLFDAWVNDRVPASALDSSPIATDATRQLASHGAEAWLAEWRVMSENVASAVQHRPGLVDDLLENRR